MHAKLGAPPPASPLRQRTGTFLNLLLTTVLVVSVSACATSKKDREDAQIRLRLGTSLLNQGQYPSALRELLIAERLDPKNEVIQNNLALAYFMRERYELALQHLQKALEINPQYTEARNNYGRTLIELTRYDQAIEELNKVLADLTYTDPVKAWVNLGLAYFRKGDFKTAKEKFAEAVRLNRENCLGHTYFGRSLLEMKDYSAAARALDNALLICKDSNFEDPYYYSGLSYYRLGKTSTAIARMEEMLKLYPSSQYAKKAESLLKLMK